MKLCNGMEFGWWEVTDFVIIEALEIKIPNKKDPKRSTAKHIIIKMPSRDYYIK